MKTLQKLSLATAVAAALLSSQAMADAWTLTQEVTATTADTTLLQKDTDGDATNVTTGADQALNNINLGASSDLSGSSQTVTVTGQDLTLTQEAATTNSIQAANSATAATITSLEQTVTGAGTIQLNQLTAAGGNTQAINRAAAATRIDGLVQTFNGALDMNQAAATNNQYGNVLETGPLGTGTTEVGGVNLDNVRQTASVSTLNMDQGSNTGDARQIVNAAIGVTQGNLTQKLDASGNVVMNQTGSAEDALQAGNALIIASEPAAANDLKQTFSAGGTLGLTQDAANGSVQAANYAGVDPAL